jgi:hypothetical protein
VLHDEGRNLRHFQIGKNGSEYPALYERGVEGPMQHDWLDDTPRARELRELHRVERWWADRDKLPRKLRLLVDAMIYLWPPRGDPGPLSENEVDDMMIARLKITHPGTTFGRTSLRTALDFVWDGKLPSKRPRKL